MANPAELRARFDVLRAKKTAIQTVAVPLREKRDAFVQASRREEEARNAEIHFAERGLYEIDMEIAQLARVMKGYVAPPPHRRNGGRYGSEQGAEMSFANDAFTDSSGTALTSHFSDSGHSWTEHATQNSSSAIISDANRFRSNSTGTSIYYIGATPAGADYDVEADIVFKTDNNTQAGVAGRIDIASVTAYWARYNSALASPAWQLYKVVAGTLTQLGSDVAQTLTADQNYRLKLEMRGTAIKLYVDGALQITASDSAITAVGAAGTAHSGTASNSTGLHLDSWSATDAGGATTLTAAAGAITLSLQAAELLAARLLPAASGAFALVGRAATLLAGRRLAADSGAFAAIGMPVVGGAASALQNLALLFGIGS